MEWLIYSTIYLLNYKCCLEGDEDYNLIYDKLKKKGKLVGIEKWIDKGAQVVQEEEE